MQFNLCTGNLLRGRCIILHELQCGILFKQVCAVELHKLHGGLFFIEYKCNIMQFNL